MGDADGKADRRSFLQVDEGNVQVPALYVQGDDILVRLYNAAPQATACTLTLGTTPTRLALVELDGRLVDAVQAAPQSDGRCLVRLTLRPFGIHTLRLSGHEDMSDHSAVPAAE